MDTLEKTDAIEAGDLKAACQEASGKTYGPWVIVCDNESFLGTAARRHQQIFTTPLQKF